MLYFGYQEEIDDPHYDYINEVVELAHHYLRQITVMIEALTEKFITRLPLFMQRVRDYLQCTLDNCENEILAHAEQQCCLQGLVFIADALLCHPDRWRGPSATMSLTRIDEDVLRATLQISSVLNNYIPLIQDSLTPLPNQKTVNTVMAHSLNTLDKRSGLYQFLGDYAAVNNVRLPSNLTTALMQHQTLKAKSCLTSSEEPQPRLRPPSAVKSLRHAAAIMARRTTLSAHFSADMEPPQRQSREEKTDSGLHRGQKCAFVSNITKTGE